MKAHIAAMATQGHNRYAVPTYEDDFAAWAHHQAMLLRAGQLHLIDRAWIAEELDTLGRTEYRTLESALLRVLQHMLKWDYQPERRSKSWVLSIMNHRRLALRQLEDNPSLLPRLPDAIASAYAAARSEAAVETDLPLQTFPDICPYGWDEIVNRPITLSGDDPEDA